MEMARRPTGRKRRRPLIAWLPCKELRRRRPLGSRVHAESLQIDGRAMDLAESYRVTVNSFMASGGDGFTVLREGHDRTTGIIDVDAAEAYFKASSPLAPPPSGRVTMLKN